jgi:hypothetical protein
LKIMSSLQKFHRRTASFGPPPTWPATAIGGGDVTYGFWLGGISTNKLIVAPKSTEVQRAWGSYPITRNTTNASDGLPNTNTLYAFGNSITTGHPAAYYCKTLTQGGYNTWYLPAIDELVTIISNKAAIPFATANTMDNTLYWSSTENFSLCAWLVNGSTGIKKGDGTVGGGYGKGGSTMIRAVRRSAI